VSWGKFWHRRGLQNERGGLSLSVDPSFERGDGGLDKNPSWAWAWACVYSSAIFLPSSPNSASSFCFPVAGAGGRLGSSS